MKLDMYIEELVHENDRDPSNATLAPKGCAQLYRVLPDALSKRPTRIICNRPVKIHSVPIVGIIELCWTSDCEL